MRNIFPDALVASLLMLFSQMILAKVDSAVLDASSITDTECVQPIAIEKPSYLIEDWKAAFLEIGETKRLKKGFISIEKVKQLLGEENLILVDIRSLDQFSAYRIPHSINIKAKQLAGKTFLKHKSIVLVNGGFSRAAISSLAADLLAKGFKQVSILDGGINGWKQSGEKIEGAGFAIKKANWISPQLFFQERKYNDLIILDFTKSQLQVSKIKIQKLLQTSLQKKAGFKSPHKNRVLIVSESGTGYEKIQQAIKELDWQHVFFLNGGKKAYQTYLARQQAIWNRPDEKQGKVNTCGRRTR